MIPDDLKKPKLGGRPSNHSLLLTPVQHDWLRQNVADVLSYHEKKAGTSSQPKLKKILADLDDKLTLGLAFDDKGRALLKANKDEVSVVSTLLNKSLGALKVAVAEYQRRGLSGTDRAKQALERNEELETLLEQVSKRLANKG